MRNRKPGYDVGVEEGGTMTEPNDYTGAELDEPLVDDLLDETRRPENPPADPSADVPADAPADEKKQQPDPPATSEVPEPPD
jgi:hypothetical protein